MEENKQNNGSKGKTFPLPPKKRKTPLGKNG
jgi:penicillin-binding protein 1A